MKSRRSKDKFYFKQFTVAHNHCGMKVGTDGVLLGAWVKIGNAKTILDIGTGSGLIALILAQRTSGNVKIDAVEIEKLDAEQAAANVKQSPWPNKIEIHNTAIQNFESEYLYDLIVSNPPYFNNSEKPPNQNRTNTRHTTTLNYKTLIESVKKFLGPKGRFELILPYLEAQQFIRLAGTHQLFCIRQTNFRSRSAKPIERMLATFSHQQKERETTELILYSEGETMTKEYKSITKEFYLHL